MLRGGESGFVKIFRDHSEERAAVGRQNLLIEELNHRVMNMLAIIQAIAQMSFSGGKATESARDAFEGRLNALAVAHNLLTSGNWEAAELSNIVGEAIRACQDEQYVIEGPPVWVEPRTAVTFAMTIHELCINATRYGAFSVPTGFVAVRWTVENVVGQPQLKLTWSESGGPPVTPPRRTGFGTRMIEQALRHELGGTVTADYLPSGLVCTIIAPTPKTATKIVAGGQVDAGG